MTFLLATIMKIFKKEKEIQVEIDNTQTQIKEPLSIQGK
jgi:hypothetical protein